jgi:hypothetical protein
MLSDTWLVSSFILWVQRTVYVRKLNTFARASSLSLGRTPYVSTCPTIRPTDAQLKSDSRIGEVRALVRAGAGSVDKASPLIFSSLRLIWCVPRTLHVKCTGLLLPSLLGTMPGRTHSPQISLHSVKVTEVVRACSDTCMSLRFHNFQS